MKSKKMLCTLALTTVIFQGILTGTAKAAIVSENRIAGSNRYETSSAISQKGWVTSDTVILASGEKFPDALCSGPLAKKYNAPVLLTSSTSISDTTLNELSRLKAKNIIIIGGTGAISTEVENELKSKGYIIDRIAGQDRYETSAMIAARLDKPTSVVIASGEGFPDALSISTMAAKLGMPILLSPKTGLSDHAKDFITNNGITKTYIVGGTGVLSSDIERQVPSPTRLAGQNRYGTNLAVIKEFESNLSYDNVYVTSDQSFADALSGAALAANYSSPIILTNGSIDANINDYLKGKITSNSKVVALGGTSVVSDSLIQNVTASQPSTGGTPSGDTTPTVPNVQDLSDGGQHTGDYTISTAGTFGDSTKTTSISGTVSVKDSDATTSDELVLQNLNIVGDLTVDFGSGNVILNNVTVNGIKVTNVGANSLHVKGNSVIQNLTVDDPNNDAHIVVEGNATIAAATVLSGANLEVAATATNSQPFSNITVAPTTSNQIMLTGTFDTVNVTAPAKVVLAPETKISAKLVATAPLEFTAPETAVVAKVDIKPSHSTDTFVLKGNLDNVNVSAVSNVQVQSGKVKISSDTNAAVKVTVAQNATVNTLADSAISLAGEGTKVTREKNTEAKVIYLRLGNGNIKESTIYDLPAAATVQKLLDSLLASAFATTQVVDASGNPVNSNVVIDSTMKLRITAEDGITVNNYALKVAALPTFEANYPTAKAGEPSSKTILVTTKANQSGHVYMVALPSGAAAPTSAQVKAGIDASGKFVANTNYDLSLGEEKVEKIAVNADNTSYDIYVVLSSANGTLQLKPVKLTATSPVSSSTANYNFTLSGLKYQIENIKNMTNIPVGTNPGDCSDQAAKDALIKALAIAQALVETGNAAQEDINNAFNGLHEAERLFKNSIVPGTSSDGSVSIQPVTLLELKNEIEHAINMTNIPVGNNPGDCSNQSAMDSLNKALFNAKTLVEQGNATEETIKNTLSELLQAEKLLSDSITTGLITPEYKPVTASSTFNQMIKVNIIGAGGFVETLNSSNIKLGGDFEGLTVKSVVMDKECPWVAVIELAGNLSPVSGYGTITVDAAGWSGMGTTHDITTKVSVVDPSILNVTWPFINEGAFTYNYGGINIGFDGDVQLPTDLSQIVVKDASGAPIQISSIHNGFYKNELKIEFSSIGNGQYSLFIPENTLTDVSGLKHNKAINFTFNIQLPNIDIEMLKKEIENFKNMLNMPVGDNVGECSQEAKDALIKALDAAQALVESGSPTQEYINRAFNALQEAGKLLKGSVTTGLMPFEYKPVIASSTFNQIIKVNIIGAGGFVETLGSNNIKLGGDFEGLTVKSVVMDKEHPWEAGIELAGSLNYVSGYGTITVDAAGWNGMGTTHDISTKIAVVDPNALNVTWPMNNDNTFTANHSGINISFDNAVQVPADWSQIVVKDSTGNPLRITSVHNAFYNNELEIEFESKGNGQYTIFIPENTLTDASGLKHNKAINFNFNVELPNVDLEMLKNEISFIQNMTNIPVGDKVGNCSDQAAKDALIKALADAQIVVEKVNPTQDELNTAFNTLQQAQKLMSNSIVTGLMPSDYRPVIASTDFNQIIKVNVAGSGCFIKALNPSNITLGGDFTGLTVKSAVVDSAYPWNASIELAGNLAAVSGYGTITVNAAGWNATGTPHDITAKVAVVDPNVLNVTWPVNNDFNNYDAFIFNHRGISIGFDSDVQLPSDWSKIIVKDSNGSQVPVTGVHYINLDSKSELQIECGFIINGQYSVYIPENTITDVTGSKPNKVINFTFKIQLPSADIEMLKNEIVFAQNAANVPVGDSVGFCPQQSIIDALKGALSDAQVLVQNSNAAQEDINRVFYALQQAEQAVGASIITGMASPTNNIVANANFNQIVQVNIIGGQFIPNLDSSYIKLGGDFEGLTIKSVVTNSINPWNSNIELEGSLNSTLGYGTITLNAAGWNGPGEKRDLTTTITVNPVVAVP